MFSRKEREKRRAIRKFVDDYINENSQPTPHPVVLIKRVESQKPLYIMSGFEYDRLYKFFLNTFNRECPGNSEELAHIYATREVDLIKRMRALKDEKPHIAVSEADSNYGGW